MIANNDLLRGCRKSPSLLIPITQQNDFKKFQKPTNNPRKSLIFT